jgi:hypothetical protein
MSDPENTNPSAPEEKKKEEGQDLALPGDDILEYLKKREGKSNPVMQFLNPKKLDELFGDEGDDAEKKNPE